jgi:protein-histidine pros-kinase
MATEPSGLFGPGRLALEASGSPDGLPFATGTPAALGECMDTSFIEALWDEIPDAIVAMAPDDTILYWNRAAEAVFGFTCAEATGKHLADLIIPADGMQEEQSVKSQMLERNLAVYDSVRRRRDGSLVHVSVSSKAIKDAEGRLRFIVSTHQDVTHLKVLRDAKLVEAKFRDLLESTPDAIVIVNVTGRIVLVNSQAERVFRYDRGELIGNPVEMLLPDRYRGTHNQHRSKFSVRHIHAPWVPASI